jgi:AhpD family alkylhydroperoxidase
MPIINCLPPSGNAIQTEVNTEGGKYQIFCIEERVLRNCEAAVYARNQNKKGRVHMKERIQYMKVAPGAYKAMLGLEQYLHESGLEASLLHLIKLRASQINGCAYCLDMHWKDPKAKQLADLTVAEATINAWNRLAISARTMPGTHHVPEKEMQKSA